jgi:hypothetical protein
VLALTITRCGRIVNETNHPFCEDGGFPPRRNIVQKEWKPKPKLGRKPPPRCPSPPEFDTMKSGLGEDHPKEEPLVRLVVLVLQIVWYLSKLERLCSPFVEKGWFSKVCLPFMIIWSREVESGRWHLIREFLVVARRARQLWGKEHKIIRLLHSDILTVPRPLLAFSAEFPRFPLPAGAVVIAVDVERIWTTAPSSGDLSRVDANDVGDM